MTKLEGRRVQELVSYLLLFRGRPHNREVLADALWGEGAATQPRKYLRQTLWQLHGSVDRERGRPPLLVADAEWIQVNPAFPLWLDTAQLESAMVRTTDIPGEEIDDLSYRALTRAVDLYRGDLLEGWYQDWCVYEREVLKAIYLAALEKVLAFCEANARAEEGLQYGRMILGHDHAHERTHRRMMRLHWLAGDRTGAIRQFEACVAYLRTELGVEPAESTLALDEQIRRDRRPPRHPEDWDLTATPPGSGRAAMPPGPGRAAPPPAGPPDRPLRHGADAAVIAPLREAREALGRTVVLLDQLLRLLGPD